MQSYETAQNQDSSNFTASLFQTILKQEQGNIFYSPYNIQTCLAMVLAGAKGNTKSQIQQALSFSNSDSIHENLAQSSQFLNSQNNVTLKTANKIFPQKNFEINKEFTTLLQNTYKSEVQQLDYETQPEPSRQEINAWVEKQTEDKIKDLLAEGSLSQDTRMVIASAIYFKGNWMNQFNKQATIKAQNFQNSDQKVDLMYQEEKFFYNENEKLQFLSMPYQGENLVFSIVLPRENESIDSILPTLNLSELEQSSCKDKVEVYIPKFKMEYNLQLKDKLQELGMKDAFSNQADLSGIAENLYVDDVVHKAFIEVNEEGAEAAAATAVTIGLMCMPMPSPQFRCDRPFLFYIKERQHGNILFYGRFNQPSE